MTAITKKAKTTRPAAEASKQIEDVIAVGKEALESAFKANASAANEGYEKVVKGYEDVVQFNQETFDAFVRSGTVLTRGLQEVSRSLFGLAQESIEESVAASKALIGAKSLKEIIELQSSLAKSNLDKLMAETTKLSDISVKVAEEAFQPLGSRFSATVEKMLKNAA